MYNLVIDIGNSFTKAAVFKEDELIELFSGVDLLTNIDMLLDKYPVQHIIYSAVKDTKELRDLSVKKKNIYIFDHHSKLPFKNKYESPETLGKDRMAAVAGVRNFIQDAPVLIIDAGTCITFDLLNEQDEYLGGAISPGLQMRFKALNTFTGRLPLVKAKENFELIGNTTETSILSGVLFGSLKEVEGVIEEYKLKYSSLEVVVTGGDINFFESNLKNKIFAIPNLVLTGLNKILNYNVK